MSRIPYYCEKLFLIMKEIHNKKDKKRKSIDLSKVIWYNCDIIWGYIGKDTDGQKKNSFDGF